MCIRDSCYTYPILKEAQMNADDKSKLKAYEELIGSLEHTNGLQHRVIETPFFYKKGNLSLIFNK